jgi:FHA domain
MNEFSARRPKSIRTPAGTVDMDQQITPRCGDQAPDEAGAEPTSAMPATPLNGHAPSDVWHSAPEMQGLPDGSAVLVVNRGPNAGARFLLNKPVTLAGRHPNSDIFLDEVTASRRHAEFREENGEFRVIDLGSLNGTYVNGELVDSAVLTNGDEIQMGKYRLVFLTGP